MQIFRAVIHNHIIELRHGDFGGETLLVNGREQANRPFAGWLRCSRFLQLVDEQGRARNGEIRLVDLSKLWVGKYRMIISVDGVERCRIEPADPAQAPNRCANCGYSLEKLPVEHGEVRCPECGRAYQRRAAGPRLTSSRFRWPFGAEYSLQSNPHGDIRVHRT